MRRDPRRRHSAPRRQKVARQCLQRLIKALDLCGIVGDSACREIDANESYQETSNGVANDPGRMGSTIHAARHQASVQGLGIVVRPAPDEKGESATDEYRPAKAEEQGAPGHRSMVAATGLGFDDALFSCFPSPPPARPLGCTDSDRRRHSLQILIA